MRSYFWKRLLLSERQTALSALVHIYQRDYKQGVALTGRNTTGPPSRAAPWYVTLHMRRRGVLQTTDAKEHH